MPWMEKKIKNEIENKEIPINIFESIQLDLNPVTKKKKRRVDDYDYNDDFIETFEGEFDPVELECKLENFFIYKGKMEEGPKRIARKYNNALKKTNLVDILVNSNQKTSSCNALPILFEFQTMLSKMFNPNSKYKKETKFENILMCLVFLTESKSKFDSFLTQKLLNLYNNEKFEIDSSLQQEFSEGSNDKEIELKNKIEESFRELLKLCNDKAHYSGDRKTCTLFQDEAFLKSVVEFLINYSKYYALKTTETLQSIKNSALEYLNLMFPEQCTNKIRMKHYLSKYIHSQIVKSNFDLERAIDGEFIIKMENSLNDNPLMSGYDGFQVDKLKRNESISIPKSAREQVNNSSSYIDSHIHFSMNETKDSAQSFSLGSLNFLQSEESKNDNKKIKNKEIHNIRKPINLPIIFENYTSNQNINSLSASSNSVFDSIDATDSAIGLEYSPYDTNKESVSSYLASSNSIKKSFDDKKNKVSESYIQATHANKTKNSAAADGDSVRKKRKYVKKKDTGVLQSIAETHENSKDKDGFDVLDFNQS